MTYARRVALIRIALMFLALSIVAEDASAQFPVSQTDRRVRLYYSESARPAAIGQFIEFRHDTVVVRLDGDSAPTFVPAGELRRVERWSRRRHIAAGATVGAIVGGLTGVVSGLSDDSCAPEAWFCYSPGESAVMFGAAGVMLGGAIGALIGALVRTDGWTELPIPKRVAVAAARDGRVAMHATLSIGGAGR